MNARDNFEKATEALNKHDAGAFARTYAPDAVVYDPQYPEPLRGRDAIEHDMTDLFRALPDARFDVDELVTDEQVAAGEYHITGTHQGTMATPEGDIAATGNAVTFDGAVFSRVNAEGEIVEEHRFYDLAGMLAQVGVKQLQLS